MRKKALLVAFISLLNCKGDLSAPQEPSQLQESGKQDGVTPLSSSGAQAVEVTTVHIVQDLLFRGCDVTQDPFGLPCRWASFQTCQSRGYAGGWGPVEIGLVEAQIVCVHAPSAVYREFPYTGMCNQSQHSSIYCDSLGRRKCQEAGFVTSSEVIGANSDVIGVLCLTGEAFAEVGTTVDELSASAQYPSCDRQTIYTNANGCQHHAHRLCRSKGYGASLGLTEYDATTGKGLLSCAHAGLNAGGFINGPQGLERPFYLGANVVGSRVPGPNPTNTPDILVNNYRYPILIRRVDYGSNYDGRNGYSRDTCVYLNRGMIWQADENDDGEIFCTYSDVSQDPNQNFRDVGVLINPGERIIFHATPRWGTGDDGVPFALNYYSWATVNVSQVGEAIPVRRIRFPKWDTGYSVQGALTINAGNESASPLPASVPPGKETRNSNWWYVVNRSTFVRGMSIFISQGGAAGIQGVDACLRIVQQGGANLSSPYCINISDDTFGPHTFDKTFGSGQAGSAFIRFDKQVPAGALIGVDFTLRSDAATHLDFVGYVWLQ